MRSSTDSVLMPNLYERGQVDRSCKTITSVSISRGLLSSYQVASEASVSVLFPSKDFLGQYANHFTDQIRQSQIETSWAWSRKSSNQSSSFAVYCGRHSSQSRDRSYLYERCLTTVLHRSLECIAY